MAATATRHRRSHTPPDGPTRADACRHGTYPWHAEPRQRGAARQEDVEHGDGAAATRPLSCSRGSAAAACEESACTPDVQARRSLTEPRPYGLSPPHEPRRFQDALEFAPLVLFGDRDAVEAAEAALRAERELLGWQVLRCFAEAPAQQVEAFQVGALGRHQSEHCDLAARHIAQRRETAGALVVVFEQDAVVLELREQPLGDRIVMALAMPLRHDVAGRRIDGAWIAL